MDIASLDPRLIKFTKESESFSATPYRCSMGHLTIGFGLNMETMYLTREQAEYLMIAKLRECELEIIGHVPNWNQLSRERQLVLIDMCYNMGISGLLTFKHFLCAIYGEHWEEVAREMEKSLWYKQVGRRAKALVNTMKTNNWTKRGE